ncbi:MAG: hypothetical protein L6V93_09215 [Clostridiales bacterium]|nr:MAG: hypothetical protein L6V93_09215 [Clostridiales bacterium]
MKRATVSCARLQIWQKSLKISVIAEGVEKQNPGRLFLNSVGCTDMQGYYYAKPMPFDRFKEFIKNKRVDGLQ